MQSLPVIQLTGLFLQLPCCTADLEAEDTGSSPSCCTTARSLQEPETVSLPHWQVEKQSNKDPFWLHSDGVTSISCSHNLCYCNNKYEPENEKRKKSTQPETTSCQSIHTEWPTKLWYVRVSQSSLTWLSTVPTVHLPLNTDFHNCSSFRSVHFHHCCCSAPFSFPKREGGVNRLRHPLTTQFHLQGSS